MIFIDVECPTCGAECCCGDQERVLRAIIAGTYPHLPMTPEQRQWCAQEADSAGEGSYDAAELLKLDDVALARTVMQAWNDYVRSNCL